jgi:hypothetical protein
MYRSAIPNKTYSELVFFYDVIPCSFICTKVSELFWLLLQWGMLSLTLRKMLRMSSKSNDHSTYTCHSFLPISFVYHRNIGKQIPKKLYQTTSCHIKLQAVVSDNMPHQTTRCHIRLQYVISNNKMPYQITKCHMRQHEVISDYNISYQTRCHIM